MVFGDRTQNIAGALSHEKAHVLLWSYTVVSLGKVFLPLRRHNNLQVCSIFGYSVNIIFVIVALLLFQRIFLFHVQFVNGMNTSYVQIRNELASEQLIKVQFQVAMSGRYTFHTLTTA